MSTTEATPLFNWLHVRRVAERVPCAFCFFIGGRGTGKTYNDLLDHYTAFKDGTAGKLLYTRLSQKAIEICATDDDNPYGEINANEHINVHFTKPNAKTDFYSIEDATNEDEPVTIGEARSLASFADLRGVNFSHITEWYFDEFIPTENVRRTPEIKKAGWLFAHAYETVNRNRELLGKPPVKVIFTANAFSLDSSILAYFGLIDVIQTMQRKGQKRYTDRQASIYIELCDAADISEAKRNTVLYRALGHNQRFVDLSINNKFDDVALYATKRDVKLIEYTPILNFNNDVTLYQHKSTGAWHFMKRGDEHAADKYPLDMRGRMLSKWGAHVRMAVAERRATFDSADTYYLVETIFDKSIKTLS